MLWFRFGFNCFIFFGNFSSQTPLCSSNEPIDILRDGVKVDGDEDLESKDFVIQFDFKSIKKVKNQLKDEKNDPLMSFEHITLLHKKSREILIEPLVEAYLNLKWQSLKGWWFGYRLLFFLAFGVCLTLMISFIVEMNSHCNYETEQSNKTVKGKLLEKNVLIYNFDVIPGWCPRDRLEYSMNTLVLGTILKVFIDVRPLLTNDNKTLN